MYIGSSVNPVFTLECNFAGLAAATEVILIASPYHFGVLIPLQMLPNSIVPMPRDLLQKQLATQVAKQFAELARLYIDKASKMAIETAIPDSAEIGPLFSAAILRMYMGNNLVTLGPHPPPAADNLFMFIAEKGVDIDEFTGPPPGSSKMIH